MLGIFLCSIGVRTTLTQVATQAAKHVAGTIIVNELLNNNASVIDKAELIMTDAETEGKKRGFEKASAEYEPAYKILEKEYEAAIKLLAKERDLYDSTLEELAEKLRCIETEQQALRMEADVMEECISRLYDIPVEEIKRGFNGNKRESTIGLVFPILDLLYVYKKNKLKKAEKQGYLEAKEVYEKKLDMLKERLRKVLDEEAEIAREYGEIYQEYLESITEIHTEIVELNIVYKGGEDDEI